MKQVLLKRTCSKCGSDKTYFDKRHYRMCDVWYHNEEGNITCDKCHCKEWHSNNRERNNIRDRSWHYNNREYHNTLNKEWYYNNIEYRKIYNILRQPRQTQLARIRRALKRGYGWTS